MKKFTVPCDFGGRKAPFTIYIGDPEPTHHPLQFQADWLAKERGGTIPPEVMDSIAKLYELAQKNNVSFEELCVYALNTAKEDPITDPNAGYEEEVKEFAENNGDQADVAENNTDSDLDQNDEADYEHSSEQSDQSGELSDESEDYGLDYDLDSNDSDQNEFNPTEELEQNSDVQQNYSYFEDSSSNIPPSSFNPDNVESIEEVSDYMDIMDSENETEEEIYDEIPDDEILVDVSLGLDSDEEERTIDTNTQNDEGKINP